MIAILSVRLNVKNTVENEEEKSAELSDVLLFLYQVLKGSWHELNKRGFFSFFLFDLVSQTPSTSSYELLEKKNLSR